MASRIPLIRMLRGKMLRIAELQDAVIVELSKRVDFVLRGGTAVWRVYGGKRFSYDIDLYCPQPESIPEVLSRSFNLPPLHDHGVRVLVPPRQRWRNRRG
ncbi:MAG: nucleotidyl transferase AbiEii/AbiGii toxin family protein [Thermofilaceae archaeon]